MKKNVLLVPLFIILSGFMTVNSYAEDTQTAEETIKTECKDESKDAESPEIYYEECVAERMQALRDEQGDSGDIPPEKG